METWMWVVIWLTVGALVAGALAVLIATAVAAPSEAECDLNHAHMYERVTGRAAAPAAAARRAPPGPSEAAVGDYAHLVPLQRRYAELLPDNPDRRRLRHQLISGYLPVAEHIAAASPGVSQMHVSRVLRKTLTFLQQRLALQD